MDTGESGADIHELVHVASGYGTDELGEMCVLAFANRESSRPKAIRFAIRINVARFRRHGFEHAETVIAKAFRRGAHARSMISADWEAMMDWQLDDVRAHLGVSEPPHYEPILPTGEAPGFADLVRGVFTRAPVANVVLR